MRGTAIRQSYDRPLEGYGVDPAHSDELGLARGVVFGSILGAFVWGLLVGVVWFCI
jgi:hypothetical protein